LRWIWDLQRAIPGTKGQEPLAIRLIPIRGLVVAAKIMARTWRGYMDEGQAVRFLRELFALGKVYPYVAYLHGQPVASAVAVVMDDLAEIRGGVHVLPAFRRRYIGHDLLVTVLRELREKGVRRVFLVRDMGEQLTEDDQAAMRLYDGCGGQRREPEVEVRWSRACPLGFQNARTVAAWLESWGISPLVTDAPLADSGAGLVRPGTGVVVSVEERPLGSLAAADELLEALHSVGTLRDMPVMGARGELFSCSAMAPLEGPSSLVEDWERAAKLSCLPLVPDRGREVDQLCLKVRRLNASGSKGRWLSQVTETLEVAGVVAYLGDSSMGFLEYVPRPLARAALWPVGTYGEDARVLTITCLRVERRGWAVADRLLWEALDQIRALEGYDFIEVALPPRGPRWLYEKFGFRTVEEGEQVAIMRRPCPGPGRGPLSLTSDNNSLPKYKK